ncbi:MAG: SCO family protein [Rhodocyclaceae bacterium]|nr:SCO family protein [Rhodocyclaceae bacterium]
MKHLLLLLLLVFGLIHAQTGNDWKRLDADEPAPAFTLTNQDGRRVALTDYQGKAVVLTFIYTECKDICPVLPQIIGRADQWLTPEEKKRVRFVGVSIDPRRDTPEKLRAFMQSHNLSRERWTLLTGTLAEATKVAGDYGIVARPDAQGDIVHNAVYVLIDPKGRLRTEFHGLFTPSQEIAKAVRGLIAKR